MEWEALTKGLEEGARSRSIVTRTRTFAIPIHLTDPQSNYPITR